MQQQRDVLAFNNKDGILMYIVSGSPDVLCHNAIAIMTGQTEIRFKMACSWHAFVSVWSRPLEGAVMTVTRFSLLIKLIKPCRLFRSLRYHAGNLFLHQALREAEMDLRAR